MQTHRQGLDFKYVVKGHRPIFKEEIFQKINRRCLSFDEAKNVRDALELIGYNIEIEEIKNEY